MSDKPKRNSQEVKQEFANVCAKLGQIGYQSAAYNKEVANRMKAFEDDIRLTMETLDLLAREGAQAEANEKAALIPSAPPAPAGVK